MTKIEPVAGDPSTEPVATAQQSHVAGRVGPPTIAQDATAEAFVPKGVEQIEPGTVLPADTAFTGGVLPGSSVDPDAREGDEAGPTKVPAPKAAQKGSERS